MASTENNHRRRDLAIDIPEEDGDLEPAPECCIYKVPRCFHEAQNKGKAYIPQLISIGPLHHDDKNLAQMESQKRRYYKKFVERTSQETLEAFSSFIKDNVKRIHNCYDVELIFDKDSEASKFTEIILCDAVFIIELFLRNFEKKVNHFFFSRSWLSLELQTDLMLLENQLPFFVLQDLYNLAFCTSDKPSFLHLACLYFDFEEDEIAFGGKEIKHFTDLFRCYVVKTFPSSESYSEPETIDGTYSATKLLEAGVKFKAVKDCMLNVKFENGVLQIPCFYVAYETEAAYRNLIAFEQCHYPGKAYFCSYIQLLDFLVDTDEDVNLLENKGIIINGMGSSEAVADMINNLMVGVAELTLCYDDVIGNLSRYHDRYWNTLMRVYFRNLWRGTGTATAFIVVILTVAQTILAILDRVMPIK
ncbi:hypothetical protein REPUB_Repub17cG0180900 [Reevesia pubescens]